MPLNQMDAKPKPRRKAAATATAKEQKPQSHKRKAQVPDEPLESKVQPFKDAPERAVTLIGVRRPAQKRIFTSIVIKAAPDGNATRIDNIMPFALKQEEAHLPLKKKVRTLPEHLFREMSGTEIDDGQQRAKKRRRIDAAPATVSGVPVNRITGVSKHGTAAAQQKRPRQVVSASGDDLDQGGEAKH